MKTKMCCVCKNFLLHEDFHKDREKPDELCRSCKKCVKEYQTQYRINNKDRLRKKAIEKYDEELIKNGKKRIMLGQTKYPEHKVWCKIIERCESDDPDYGGRGISICKEWREDFWAFYRDIGPRPNDKMTIDRIDVNGNYEPGNCRWATQKEQQNNRRNNKLITCNGVTKTLAQWKDETGLSTRIICYRIEERGMTPEEALSKKAKKLGPKGGQNLPCEQCGELFNTSWCRPGKYCSKRCARYAYHSKRKTNSSEKIE